MSLLSASSCGLAGSRSEGRGPCDRPRRGRSRQWDADEVVLGREPEAGASSPQAWPPVAEHVTSELLAARRDLELELWVLRRDERMDGEERPPHLRRDVGQPEHEGRSLAVRPDAVGLEVGPAVGRAAAPRPCPRRRRPSRRGVPSDPPRRGSGVRKLMPSSRTSSTDQPSATGVVGSSISNARSTTPSVRAGDDSSIRQSVIAVAEAAGRGAAPRWRSAFTRERPVARRRRCSRA